MASTLSARFRFPDRTLWLGRAQLHYDRVELTGWSWSGRFARTIPLSDVEKVEWWTGSPSVNFALHLEGGETVALHLKKAAGRWKFAVDSRLEDAAPKRTELPGDAAAKDAAA